MKIRVACASVLTLFLSLQLTGLTCLKDFQLVASSDGSRVSVGWMAYSVSPNSSDEAPSSPVSSSFGHDCPCHYAAVALPAVTSDSAPYAAGLAAPLHQSIRADIPRSIFRPPVLLS